MSNSTISSIKAIEILDSRGFPTLKTTVTLENGVSGSTCVPSGASTGKFEAVELRDGDNDRYLGKGVLKAIRNVNEHIQNELKGKEIENQELIDNLMIQLDGTENKARLGANAILSVSLAAIRAAAKYAKMPLYQYIGKDNNILPVPMCNVINGGAHASNNLDIQEFMIIPTVAKSFSEGLRMSVEVFHNLKKLLLKDKKSIAVGDEGGFAPDLASNDVALEFLNEAVHLSGYENSINYALDAAVSEWITPNGDYFLPKANVLMTKAELIEYWKGLVKKFPIISIEDGANEEDWQTWQMLNRQMGENIQLVGDDLFVTNTARLQKGITLKAANSILIKPNQIGTLTETINAINMAKRAGFTTVMSHRSGETEDAIIADLAVGLGTDQIKTGSLSRSERTSKYNRLLEIENELGERAVYKGENAFN